MHITQALSVDLALLTRAVDRPEIDIVQTLHQFAVDARIAVRSYLGLSLIAACDEPPFTFTALEEHATPGDIRSSLLMPQTVDRTDNAAILVLYAARAGAFVDLAADLSWLTGVDLSDYCLDQHLSTIAVHCTEPTVHTNSVINQAIGVLIGRGHLPEEAHKRLTAQAVEVGTHRYAAAVHILSTLTTDTDWSPELR